jgi:glycosyltransferase involved in cell wall biosynthesis
MVLIPALNEEGAIASVVDEVHAVLPGVTVLVVDDGSEDGTVQAAKQAGARVLRMPVHLGLGGAVQAGYKFAYELGFDFVIRVDGDGQHDPKDIPRILEVLQRDGVEMVIGSRFNAADGSAVDGGYSSGSWVRSAGIAFFRAVLRPILGKPVHDPTSGFVGVNRAALTQFSRVFPLEYPEIEALVVLQRKRFRFAEVPCKMRPRKAGRSSITVSKSLYYVLHVLLGVFVNVLRLEGRRIWKWEF